MASSYSTDLKLELMVTGENAGTWGDNTNNNLNLIQQAIAGYEAVALTDGGTVALAMTDKTISNARNMVLKFTGTLTSASIVTIPDSIEKFYIFDCSAVVGPTNLTIKTASGTGFTLDAAKIYAAYSDGTNLNEVSLDTLGGTIGSAQIADASVTTAKISDNAVTTAKISDNQITTAKISANQITTAKISDNQITTAKISDNQVTAAKLDDVFGGTPGEFTAATVTVDAQGRITAASSGSAGAGGFLLKTMSKGPASGTYTANPSANLAAAYMMSGGGGGGGGAGQNGANGGAGGTGVYGYYSGPVSGGTGYPFSSGVGGNAGAGGYNTGGTGGAGGATNLSIFGTVNGGNGGNGGRRSPAAAGNPGSSGTLAPGFDVSIPQGNNFLMPGGGGGNGGNGQTAINPQTGSERGNPGNAGAAGFIAVYDNAGT